MGKVIEVDWAEVRNTSNKFQENANTLREIGQEYNEIIDSLEGFWQGPDSSMYVSNSKKFSETLDNEAAYLQNWNEFMSKAAVIYETNYNQAFSELQAFNSSYEFKE